jgi:hypothetical protein
MKGASYTIWYAMGNEMDDKVWNGVHIKAHHVVHAGRAWGGLWNEVDRQVDAEGNDKVGRRVRGEL